MSQPLDLPPGFAARPLASADAGAVTAVIAANELAVLGEVVIEEADIVAEWARPSFDIAAQTVGVLHGDRVVAYAEYSGGERADAAVHPDVWGRGIGTTLARWVEATARAAGERLVGMPVPAGSPGDVLLRALGWHERWTSWVLSLPPGRRIEPQPLPAAYEIRVADGEAEVRAAWTVVEDAFLEWSDRERMSFEDWDALITRRPGHEPWMLRLIVDRGPHAAPGGEVVGACHIVVGPDRCGFVDRLAVRRDHRNRGLARALLADAFAQARAHGALRSELSTDSRTGALELYEKVGMEVTSTWVNLAARL